MKTKQILMPIALFFAVVICKAQIPNSGFENWTNMGTYQNPEQWGTMNNVTASTNVYTATKGTPGSPGTAYLKLTSLNVGGNVVNGIAVSGVLDTITLKPKSGFAYNLRPASLTGKWQHMISGTSQGSITASLTKWNTNTNSRDTIATAKKTLSGMAMSWAAFTINFSYLTGDFPDSCTIFLKASGNAPANQDYLWVDNLALAGSVAGIDNALPFLNKISVYPNPAHQSLKISLDVSKAHSMELELIDESGNIVYLKNIGSKVGLVQQNIEVSEFARGNYILRIKTEVGIVTRKIVLE